MKPCETSVSASCVATELFPTPPLPLNTSKIEPILDFGNLAAMISKE